MGQTQQTRVYPYPLGAGSARPNPKMGVPDPENPLFLGFAVLRGGLRPWSQTMVSEGARPWGRGRSADCDKRLSARFCCFRRFFGQNPRSAVVFCKNPRLPNAVAHRRKGRKRRRSAKREKKGKLAPAVPCSLSLLLGVS